MVTNCPVHSALETLLATIGATCGVAFALTSASAEQLDDVESNGSVPVTYLQTTNDESLPLTPQARFQRFVASVWRAIVVRASFSILNCCAASG
jgi:hypothetical protein